VINFNTFCTHVANRDMAASFMQTWVYLKSEKHDMAWSGTGRSTRASHL